MVGLGLDGYLGRIDGLVLCASLVIVLASILRGLGNEPEAVQERLAAYAATRTWLWLNLLRLAIAAGLLHLGARCVVAGGLELGQAWNLTPLLAGLLPVAIGTALPEVAAALAAARRGQGDMVAGHVFGASLCHLPAVIGATAVAHAVAHA